MLEAWEVGYAEPPASGWELVEDLLWVCLWTGRLYQPEKEKK